MAKIKYDNIGIRAVSACVPANISSNYDLKDLIGEDDLMKTIKSIGIEERRIADENTCTSDLCYQAAKRLIEDNSIPLDSIDALIFVSQTPDYRQPATSVILQDKLGLSKSTLAIDVNIACSGYVYGLSIAYSFANQQGVDRVLLLVGETMSKLVSKSDKVNTPLFGDAGTATLIEKGNYGQAFFSLHSDGSGYDVMMVPYGGFRNPSCAEGLKEVTDDNGDVHTGEQFRMDGMDVFNFGMRVEPKDIRELLQFADCPNDQVDLLIFHQANKFMTDFFTKKLKFDPGKTPYCLKKYGNTSSASIPLTIVTELKNAYPQRNRVILSGFGAGLSWGSCLIDLSRCKISDLIEL